jgi:antitoxin component YwqK of YwqJK toxin-antitoxin module
MIIMAQVDTTNKNEISKSFKLDTVTLKYGVGISDFGYGLSHRVIVKNDTLFKVLFFSDANNKQYFGGTYNNYYGSIYYYYPTGELESIDFVYKGKSYGVTRNFYKNNNLESIGTKFDPGIRDSIDSVFVEGKMWYTAIVNMNYKRGLWQYFNERGELIKEELYDDEGIIIKSRSYRKDD